MKSRMKNDTMKENFHPANEKTKKELCNLPYQCSTCMYRVLPADYGDGEPMIVSDYCIRYSK